MVTGRGMRVNLTFSHDIITIYAMGCQKEIATWIHDEKADSVLVLKDKHATALEEVKSFFAEAFAP